MKISNWELLENLIDKHKTVSEISADYRISERHVYRRWRDNDVQTAFHSLIKHKAANLVDLATKHHARYDDMFNRIERCVNDPDNPLHLKEEEKDLHVALLCTLYLEMDTFVHTIENNKCPKRTTNARIHTAQHDEAITPPDCNQSGKWDGCN